MAHRQNQSRAFPESFRSKNAARRRQKIRRQSPLP
jgi:hypothetical protein